MQVISYILTFEGVKMKVLKQILFFIILGSVILLFNELIEPKDENYDKYKIFNELEDYSINVCYTGTSTSDAAINPEIIDNIAGCNSFNYSVTGMRIQHLYFRMVDMLKTQKPELIVIDTTAFIPIQENTKTMLLRWAFNALPLSSNKHEAVDALVDDENKKYYYINYPSYHNRIFELTAEDWKKSLNLYEYPIESFYPTPSKSGWRNLGESCLEKKDDFFMNDYSKITEEYPLDEEQKEYLEKTLDLCSENDIKVLFLSTPYKYTQEFTAEINVKVNNYLRNNYESENVKVLDMNTKYKELGFDYCYLKDEGHTNREGAELISNFLGEYLRDNYNFN